MVLGFTRAKLQICPRGRSSEGLYKGLVKAWALRVYRMLVAERNKKFHQQRRKHRDWIKFRVTEL